MKPWIVVDLMTGEYLSAHATQNEALTKCIGKPYDVQYLPRCRMAKAKD